MVISKRFRAALWTMGAFIGCAGILCEAAAGQPRWGDHAGRLTTTTDPLEQVVARTYDAAGRNDSLRNARGKTWLFGFTATGQPETLTTPLSLLTDTAYTVRGQPATVTEPSLQATAFAYFDDARLHTATDAVGTITYGYDANGRLETVVEGGKTITRHYNALGQLDTFTDSAGNAIAYKYDGAGNLTELTYPGSPARTVTYAYDSADRLATVTDWAARVTHFRYDPATSRLSRIELPNGTQRVFTYDSAGRVASVRDEVAAGGVLVSQFTLGYDALDRIVEETTLPEPAPFAVAAASMIYDADDRLTGWNAFTTASDADGNLTQGPLGGALATFAYDARNRLTNVGNTSYTYDAENRRITRTATGITTTFVHDPNAALSRLLQSRTGSTTTRYVYAGSLLLYAETGSALRVHHYDYRSSTVALTDATGAVLGRVTYGSYGEIVARTGNTSTEFLYNGRDGVVTDPNGLYHMRARYYSPEPRRFLNADPIGFAGGNNWYILCDGNPIALTDPSGKSAWDWISNGVAVVGGALQVAGGVAIVATTGWTGVGGVAGAYLIASGGASVIAGGKNMYDLATDQKPTLNNSGLVGLVTSLATSDPRANAYASGADIVLNLASGVGGLNAARIAVTEGLQYGSVGRMLFDFNNFGTIRSAKALLSSEEIAKLAFNYTLKDALMTALGIGATTTDTVLGLWNDNANACPSQ